MPHEPDAKGTGREEGGPVEVARVQGEMEAQVIRSLLESSGIFPMLSGEALRITHGLTIDGLGEVRILVRSSEADKARRVIYWARQDHTDPE